jgi:hypothetical protein
MSLLALSLIASAYVQPAARVASGRAAVSVVSQAPRTCIEMARGKPPGFMDPTKGRGGPPPLPDDGIPAFTLFVRSPTIGLWYPVSVLKGDKPTRALVDAIANNGIGADMAKSQLNEGLAKSIFNPAQNKQLVAAVLKQYKALKTGKDNLEWGYKVNDKYLQQRIKEGALPEPKITVLTEEMTADRTEQAKTAISKTAANVWKALTGKNES